MNYKEIIKGFEELYDIDNGKEVLEEVLADMAFEFEPHEAGKAVLADVASIKSQETYDLLNRFFTGIFGWSLDTLLERTKAAIANTDEDEDDDVNEALIGMWTLVSMLGADEVETTAYNNLEDACFAARDWDSKVSCDFIGVRDEDGTWMIWFDKCGESGTDYDGNNDAIEECINEVLNY